MSYPYTLTDAALEVMDDGCVYVVCQMCLGTDEGDWNREVTDLREAMIMWDAHVEQVHS